jgi:septal ring factor EnvC (AmiA/AmiB activator)
MPIVRAEQLTELESQLARLDAEIERLKVGKVEVEMERDAAQKKIDDYRNRYSNS